MNKNIQIDKIINILDYLVSLNTVNPNDILAIDVLKKRYKTKLTNLEHGSGEGFLWIKLSGKDSSKCTILNGHIDTVPIGDLSNWDSDPLKITTSEDNSIIYGLGVTDMKSGLAVMLDMLESKSNYNLINDCILTIVSREEVDGQGSNNLMNDSIFLKILEGYNYTECLILEPTNASWWGDSHRGNIFYRLKFKNKDLNNSVKEYHEFYKKLKTLQNDCINQVKTGAKPTFSITNIYSTANELVCMTDFRTTEYDHSLIKEFIESYPLKNYEFINDSEVIPASFIESSASKYLTNIGIPKKEFIGATDMPFFTNKLIPSVIYGPGDITKMHLPNESIAIKDILNFHNTLKEYLCIK